MTKLKMLDELNGLYNSADKQGWKSNNAADKQSWANIAQAIAIAENTVISEIDWSTAIDKWEAKK